MRSLLSLSLLTLAASASAADICGVAGHNGGTGAYWWSITKDTNTLTKCAKHCQTDNKGCKSYAFGAKEGKCLHYSVSVAKNIRKDAKSLYVFYDRGCSTAQPLRPDISQDGRCGKDFGGKTCKGSEFGNCCSQYSYCGTTHDHCRAESCQSGYGDCTGVTASSSKALSSTTASATSISSSPSSPSSTQAISTDARCGRQFGGKTCKGSKFGNCCSQYSYCGSTPDHCRAGSCQLGFGDCTGLTSSSKAASSSKPPSSTNADLSSTSVSPSSPSSTQAISKDARCGRQFGGTTCKGSKFGDCCSQYSYCGSTNDYCRADSCQRGYGDCKGSASPSSVRTTIPSSQASSSTSSEQQSESSTEPSSASATDSSSTSATESSGSALSASDSSSASASDSISASASVTDSSSSAPDSFSASATESASGSDSVSSTETSATAPSASACPGVKGYSTTATNNIPSLTQAQCAERCSSDGRSESYGFGKPCSACAVVCTCHNDKLSQHVSSSSSSGMTYYNFDCADSAGASTTSSTDVSESTESASSSGTASSVSTEEISSTISDSPPYIPTGDVIFPSNAEDIEKFLATYTWQDDPLPTPVEMGTAPLANGFSPAEANLVKSCIVDPTHPEETFELLDSEDRIPLVLRDGSLTVPTAPKSEEEYKNLPSIDDIKFASFSFAVADNGLFDLVVDGQYVARMADGTVTLTDESTGASADSEFATSIFEITCQGRITIRIDDQHYTWTLRDNGSVMDPADGTPETMYALPNTEAGKLRRRTKSQDGAAPRCDSQPRGLEARVFPGARGNNPNQCGSSSFNVPDLSFGSCCDKHDNDFDNCGLTFEEGNDNFHSCMRGSGCQYLDHWWSYLAWVACRKTADFYYSVVSGYFGKQAFKSANNDRCRCYCESSRPHACMVNGGPQCLNVFGDDTNNCGACGRKCPATARCVNGQCRCPVDQCGDRCVTLASHPQNCGQCGRVSPSGYCLQGQFYTPPAFCSKGNGFRNGNFANGKSDWTAEFFNGDASFEVGPDGSAEDGDGMVAIVKVDTFVLASLKTSVKMCPGLTYNFSFHSRIVAGNRECLWSVSVAGEQLTQEWMYSNEWVPWSGLRVGPFSGERAGVRALGPELWADFELGIICDWNFNIQDVRSEIRVDQLALTPV